MNIEEKRAKIQKAKDDWMKFAEHVCYFIGKPPKGMTEEEYLSNFDSIGDFKVPDGYGIKISSDSVIIEIRYAK